MGTSANQKSFIINRKIVFKKEDSFLELEI